MTEQTPKQDIRCPACGQRMGIDKNKTEFTCVNCKKTQTIPNRMSAAPNNNIIGSEEFMDIWRNPYRHTEAQRIMVRLELAYLPMDKWPQEIQQAQKEFAARRTRHQKTKRIVFMLFVLFLFYLLLFMG